MRDRDAALDSTIHEVAAILGDALVRLLFPDPASHEVDLLETESLFSAMLLQPFAFLNAAHRFFCAAAMRFRSAADSFLPGRAAVVFGARAAVLSPGCCSFNHLPS